MFKPVRVLLLLIVYFSQLFIRVYSVKLTIKSLLVLSKPEYIDRYMILHSRTILGFLLVNSS